MSKREFFRKMELCLVDLPYEERIKFINYYDEIINDYLESGLSEFDAIERIGNPKEIAAKLLEEMGIKQFVSSKSIKNRCLIIVTFPVWATIFLSVSTVLVSILLSLIAIEFGLIIVGIVSCFGSPIVMSNYHISVGIVQLGMGIISIGISITLFPLLSWSYLKVKVSLLGMVNILKRFW